MRSIGQPGHWALLAMLVLLFLTTRLLLLDSDVPPWPLAQYQPIDEFAYVLPALNLHHYGTWVHQDTPYVPLEGWPMNALQSAVTALTLALSWTYWGFRLSSVLFGLVAFLCMVSVARGLVRRARDDDEWLPLPPTAILAGVALLLVFDFGFLTSGRIVEATTARVAMVAGVLWLIDRGTFLGPVHGARRSIALGFAAGAAATFGYIYNAFLVPGVVVLLALWFGRSGGIRLGLRHAALAVAGAGGAFVLYFGLVYAVYGDGPVQWYERWVSPYREAGRANQIDLTRLWDLVTGNSLRLDHVLLLVALISIPPFTWWAWQRRSPLGMAVIVLGIAFSAQTVLQSDYPNRKMLVVLPLLLPLALGGMLRLASWTRAVRARPRAFAGWIAWVIAALVASAVVTLPTVVPRSLRLILGMPAGSEMTWTGFGGGPVIIGGVIGAGALVALLLAMPDRRRTATGAVVVLGLSMLVPLVVIDARFVYLRPTFTYRDAMIEASPELDGSVTAGGTSYAMQLYNGSRPVLEGYVYGMGVAEYEAAVVRYFRECRASGMFAYADGASLERWTGLGFELVRSLDVILPRDHVLGWYTFAGQDACAGANP